MMKMMTMEKVGEVFRRPSSLFNNPFISFLKHSLGFTHNREDLMTIKVVVVMDMMIEMT